MIHVATRASNCSLTTVTFKMKLHTMPRARDGLLTRRTLLPPSPSRSGHEHSVSCVAFLPSGDQLVSCSRDKTIRVWQTETGHCLKTLSGHAEWVRHVAVSPDGELIASCGQDQSVRIWNWSSGVCTSVLDGHEHVVECVAWSSARADTTIVAAARAAAISTCGQGMFFSSLFGLIILVGEPGTGRGARTGR